MSGGHFDYKDLELFNLLDEKIVDDDLKKIVKIVGDWVHAYDWCVSGDTGKETYQKEKQQAIFRLKKEVIKTKD
jgi:hypothetical protein